VPGSEELESHGLDIEDLSQHTHSAFEGTNWLFALPQGSGESQLISANTAQSNLVENHLINNHLTIQDKEYIYNVGFKISKTFQKKFTLNDHDQIKLHSN